MSSKTYWEQREAEALKHYLQEEQEYQAQLRAIYQNMLDAAQKEIDAFYGRYADKEQITLAEAKRRVSKLDIAAYERKARRYVADKDFSKQANEEMRLYNLTMKVNRLEMLKANIGLELVAGHNEQEQFMSKILRERTEAELQRQAGILGKTVRNNAKLAETIPNASFHGATFSERIWGNQAQMKADLSKLLQQGLIQGKNPRALSKDLRKYYIGDGKDGGAAYAAERLMRTELARVQTEAQRQSFLANGFEEYTFHVNRGCCSACSDLDGKHFKIKDMMPGKNAPPMHPNCRCSVSAYEDDTEYEAWLDFLDKGGTTEEWENTKSTRMVLENSENDGKMSAEASPLPNRFKRYLPESGRRNEIIEEGKNLERPIFADGLLGELAKTLKPLPNYYDVVLHGEKYGLYYFGDKIDVETLCAIIAQRKDYKKGTNIRLISCNTGAAKDGVAQYVADKLHVTVLAPDKNAVVYRKWWGLTDVFSGSDVNEKDGEFISFEPNKGGR